ncbi:MAG: WD40 repeat domain-containing protein [Gemmataceae bacterium]|nr:WD40 repeat domain-containing protein [Gemmataceae bacterium]
MQVFHLPGLRLEGRSLAFCPDGRFLAAGSQLSLVDTVGGEVRSPADLNLGFCSFAFLPGGSARLLVSRFGHFESLDLGTGERQSFPVSGGVIDFAIDPAGNRLFAFAGNRLCMAPLADPAQLTPFAEENLRVYQLTISADGRRLAGYCGGSSRVWDVGGAELPSRGGATLTGSSRGFALSADGTRLASVFGTSLSVWDADTGAEVWRSGKHRRAVMAVAYNLARPLLATGDNLGKVFLWDAGCRVVNKYDWELGSVAGLAFAPDGLRCAAVDADGKLVIWDVDV